MQELFLLSTVNVEEELLVENLRLNRLQLFYDLSLDIVCM